MDMTGGQKRKLIIVAGPTGVGKSDLSVALAHRIGGEVISADSMQVYRGMDIGTAKMTVEEMAGIRHHLIDVCDPDEEWSVVRFQQMAKDALTGIYDRGHIPILCGGTGFYIQALLYDIDFTENDDDGSFRRELEMRAEQGEGPKLYEELKKVDPEAAEAIHPNNTRRVIRALEFYRQTGLMISDHNREQKERPSAFDSRFFVITDSRTKLYERTDRRVDRMLKAGLEEEVRALREKGYDRSLVSMQGLGYKEILSWLEGEICFEEAVRILKRDTRHFAKRQLTWFRRERDVIWISREDYPDDEKILEKMISCL